MPNEDFSLKVAYSQLRTAGVRLFSNQFIWHKLVYQKQRLFLWRFYHGSLPIPKNLAKFAAVYPTRCPFCLMDTITSDHIFLTCSEVLPIWRYYASCFDGPVGGSLRICPFLLQWWISTQGKSLKGQLRIIIRCLIMWKIWKSYTSIIFGDGCWCCRLVFEYIKRSTYEWTLDHKGKKYIKPDATLVQLGLIPVISSPRCRVVRWMLPPFGRHKLNVDAAYGRFSAAAGAIFRDSNGAFTRVISFPQPVSSPDKAEL